jgi:hypothetical protein
MKRWFKHGALAAGLAALIGSAPAAAEMTGAWNERVQVFYDEAARTVFRQSVRAWDAEPEKNLDFLWEPAPGTVLSYGADGAISGTGTLTWRVRGSASYDPAAVHAVYSGEMRDGRPDGRGRLEKRSGETLEGEWRAGILEGDGVHVDALGNRYEGGFRNGKPEGQGRYLAANGEIFEGGFVGGLRHGAGMTTLPGGTRYASTWRMGVETGERPDAVADAQRGGFLRIQDGESAAARTEFSVTVDQRMNQQAEGKYLQLMRDTDLAIYPASEGANEAWNGDGVISAGNWVLDAIDWDNTPVFVEARLATTDNSRVRLDSLQLEVSDSQSYRKPMLTLMPHHGCVGFRPTFSFVNRGWGPVEDAELTVRFTGDTGDPDAAARTGDVPSTRAFSGPVEAFDEGTDIDLTDALARAGVDVDALAKKRLKCPSEAQLPVCRAQLFNSVRFGELADFVWGERFLLTRAIGTLSYRWTDPVGAKHDVTEPFHVDISLAVVELDRATAECGDLFGLSPEALRYQEVDLPVDRQNYSVDLPVRGNKNIRDYTARLKIQSQMSSIHSFEVTAAFEDGSVRRSKPTTLYFFRPRQVYYSPTTQPDSCYLLEGPYAGC